MTMTKAVMDGRVVPATTACAESLCRRAGRVVNRAKVLKVNGQGEQKNIGTAGTCQERRRGDHSARTRIRSRRTAALPAGDVAGRRQRAAGDDRRSDPRPD